jgi:hypothetical protein
MRYMSRKRVLVAGLVLAVCASGLATVATAASDDLYLPVLPLVDAALLGYLLFFLSPVLAAAAVALGARHSVRFALVAAAVTGLVVVTLSWAGWIGLIVNECVLQDNRCFD